MFERENSPYDPSALVENSVKYGIAPKMMAARSF